MSMKNAVVAKARGLAFAVLPLVLLTLGDAARGGEPKVLGVATIRGLDGQPIELTPPAGGASVVVFYSSECPISNAYSPTFDELRKRFAGRPVKWTGICVDPDLTDAEVRAHARDFKLIFAVARDRHGAFARKIGATMTPEAFVLDDHRRIRYYGRIDDQFAARGVRNAAPTGADLRDAIAAVLDGKPVAAQHVPAVGCPIPEPPESVPQPTYSRDVAPILQKNCQECHRRGQVAPFALETYKQARKRASDIASVVEERRMPPWKASPHYGVQFRGDRSLAEKDIATLIAWSESGAPEGDRGELPPNPKFSDDWALGKPDLVLDIGTDFQVPTTGDDIYRCFVVPTNLAEDRYVTAIEYRVGNRRVVHHILAYVDISGQARKRDAADPGPGFSCFSGPGEPIHGDLGGWAPGIEARPLPDGIGRSLPKGADVIIQVHYHASGKPETDRTRIGLHFARKPVRQILHWAAAVNPHLELPPGQPDVEIKAAWKAPVDLVAHAVTPHMHLLGRDMEMFVTLPNGRTQELIKIDDWDFNWQYSYFFRKPIDLPRGSILNVVAHYDNTDSNPRNPNHPPKLVKWGEATTDEMCIGFIAVTKKDQDLTRPGEKDDLLEIFAQQRARFQQALKDAQERDRKARAAGGGK